MWNWRRWPQWRQLIYSTGKWRSHYLQALPGGLGCPTIKSFWCIFEPKNHYSCVSQSHKREQRLNIGIFPNGCTPVNNTGGHVPLFPPGVAACGWNIPRVNVCRVISLRCVTLRYLLRTLNLFAYLFAVVSAYVCPICFALLSCVVCCSMN